MGKERNHAGGAGDAGFDGAARRVWGEAAAEGAARHGVAAYDDSDGRLDRDAERAGGVGAVVFLQYFFDAGSRGGGRRRWAEGNGTEAGGGAGVCVEG